MIEIDFEKVIDDFKDLKVLFVEDNADARESTIIILEEFFEQITIAIDGKDGLEKFKQGDFNLIITDIQMPNLNGIEMSKEIRKLNNTIPIIILSAYNENEYLRDSIKIGMLGYINKPVDIEELILNVYKSINNNNIIFNDDILDEHKDNIDVDSIITILDTNGIVVYVNDNFSKIVGYKVEDIIGKPYHTFSKESRDIELIDQIWDTLQNKQQSWKGTIRYVNNFDKMFFLRGEIKPILNKNGEIIKYIAIRENITNVVEDKIEQYVGGDFSDE
ncbi:MAG: response regulator [Campylobacterota bacterium]|nr:response regulator [Campylobacterota bacterium]